MNNEFRKFCPKNKDCSEECKTCLLIKDELGHEINKNYLQSIGKICLCADCCDE
jgi:hypothetical protein